MHRHGAYGLTVASELHLPELPPANGEPDIFVRLGEVDDSPPEAPDGTVQWRGGDAHLSYAKTGRLMIRGGREVVVDASTEADEGLLRTLVVGPALAVALHQRGFRVLHASAVSVEGRAVGFLGDVGEGKSTIAAALQARGHELIADDVVALEPSREGFSILPGVRQLKLWPHAAAAIGLAPERLPRLYAGIEKRSWRLASAPSPAAAPLARLYVLAEAPVARIEPLAASESVIELVRLAYGPRSFHASRPDLHLAESAELARAVPVLRLSRPRRLEELPRVAALVERDALGEPGATGTVTASR